MALTKAHKSNIGSFDKRVEFQNWTESSGDGMGGSEGSWSTETTLYAGITPISGREKLHMNAVESDISHIVSIRYNEFDVSAKSRIQWGSRTFDLHSVINKGEDGAYFELTATEQA